MYKGKNDILTSENFKIEVSHNAGYKPCLSTYALNLLANYTNQLSLLKNLMIWARKNKIILADNSAMFSLLLFFSFIDTNIDIPNFSAPLDSPFPIP